MIRCHLWLYLCDVAVIYYQDFSYTKLIANGEIVSFVSIIAYGCFVPNSYNFPDVVHYVYIFFLLINYIWLPYM